MKLLTVLAVASMFGMPASAASSDPFAGTWEARVATGTDSYTMRLTCRSQSDCELQRSDTTKAGKPTAETIPFKGTRPLEPSVQPMANALRYALEHRAEASVNMEFAAVHRLLAASVDAKTEVDACIGLDDRKPDFFVACTVRGATSKRPMLLLFGSMLGLCGQGFCKHVVYPLVKSGGSK